MLRTISIRRRYILLYLLSKTGTIDHDRLFKLVFILSNKLKPLDIPFNYKFKSEGLIITSEELSRDLEDLTRIGFIKTKVKIVDEIFNLRVHEYSLSAYGKEVAKRTSKELGDMREELDKLIKEWMEKSDDRLDKEVLLIESILSKRMK